MTYTEAVWSIKLATIGEIPKWDNLVAAVEKGLAALHTNGVLWDKNEPDIFQSYWEYMSKIQISFLNSHAGLCTEAPARCPRLSKGTVNSTKSERICGHSLLVATGVKPNWNPQYIKDQEY